MSVLYCPCHAVVATLIGHACAVSAGSSVCHALARGNEQNGENSHKEGSAGIKEVRTEVSTSPACILHASSVCLIAFEGLHI